MKTMATLLTTLTFFALISLAQKPSIDLMFNGDNNGDNVELDSIYIKNLTQSADIMIYPPDTSFTLLWVGINESSAEINLLNLTQNFPNPFKEKTEFTLFMGKNGSLEIKVFNILGKQVTVFQSKMNKGSHTFSFNPGSEKVYLLSASAFGITKSIKMFCSNVLNGNCNIEHLKNDFINVGFKSTVQNKDFPYNPGDVLLFVGYSALGESGMLDSPEESKTYTFQYATNIPCIGTPTVDYEGQTYNTIQIYSQCWLKENLNVGTMINAPEMQTNNNIIEKYCMANYEDNCNIVGGLYYWDEMMQYVSVTGAQGICPGGWHIPSDVDWQVLEGAVDSEYKIGNSTWGSINWRGADAGGNLKEQGTTNWEPPNTGATDAFGFTALPGGYFVQGEFWGPGYKGYFWSSQVTGRYCRNMDWNTKQVKRQSIGYSDDVAISVRCVKDLN